MLLKSTRVTRIALVLFGLSALFCSAAFGAEGTYKVRVAKDLKNKDAAESLRTELKKEGYTPVDVIPTNGGFTVLVGAARTKQEAQVLVKDLKGAGFTPEDIEEPGAGATATTAGAAPPGVSSGGGSKSFRVLVHDFPKADQAEEGKQSLKNEGFTNVDVTPEDGKYKLYVGTFPTQGDADALLEQIRAAGFAMAQVATVDRRLDTATVAAATPPPLSSLPANLTASQKQDAASMLEKAEKANKGELPVAEYQQLQKDLKGTDNESIKKFIAAYDKERGEKTEIQNKLWTLYRDFDNLLDSRNYDAARKKLDEIKAVDPKDATLQGKQQRLEKLMAGGGGAPAATQPGSQGTASRTGKGPDPEQVQQAMAEARKAEAEGNLSAALARYNKVVQIDATHVEARSKVAELNNKVSTPAASSGTTTTNQKLMYGGGGALVLIILALGYWNFVNGRREKKLEAQVRELSQQSSKPAVSAYDSSASQTFVDPLAPGGMYSSATSSPATSSMGGMGAGIGETGGSGSKLFASGMEMAGMGSMIGGADEEEEEKPPQPEPEPPMVAEEVGDDDLVSISGMNFDSMPLDEEEPVVEQTTGMETTPVFPPPGSEGLSLGDLDLGFNTTPPPMQTPAEPVGAAPAPSMSMPDLDLDALLRGTFPGAGTAAADDDKPSARIEDISPMQLPSLNDLPISQEERSIHDEVTLREMNASGVAAAMGGLGTAPTVHIPTPFPMSGGAAGGGGGAASSTPAPTLEAAPPGAAVHHEQSFDHDPVGSQPEAWKGDYDYASLTVDDQNSVDGSGRCLKFEKRSGAGSASYHCTFPNAAGQVTVEFDIRCDDKNKYLLGFYVEKDEDFKQSVHTIVHRIDSRSQPSLRIQGEPVPYELGSWRHVKYELNLLIGVVNAYVDDQHVVKDAKLPTIPAYVNTLSIRDNLATTGLMYLDNIRITRR